ncbi:c-type cytochrome [Geomonas propionica]|uniref:Cytochrome c n=1 Tax=Geomonas propionica TaxID=2798582 RepID=A0ABS0YWC3_9BACT|nr:cytochrome c [Geomonas propionica]MBJ6802256.1 cytochrome c [Geomonas propionica]
MEKAVLRKLTTLCVVCGLVCLVLLGVAGFRDTNREWKYYQEDYREKLMGKLGRDKNPAMYQRVAEMKPELKQVVVTEWQTVDRCVTCHISIEDPLFAQAGQPLKTHPYPELLKQHPVERFGCTICHGGQGLATTYYGSSHEPIHNWPVTLVTKGLMQSRCGYCHKDFEAIKADKLIAGRALYQELHCAGCHQINGQGGAVGPDLSSFADKDPSNFSLENLKGSRSKQNWVIEHFQDPQRVSPGSPMRGYAMSDKQVEALASYVLSLNQREFTRKYTPKLRAGYLPPRVDTVLPEPELGTTSKVEADGNRDLRL